MSDGSSHNSKTCAVSDRPVCLVIPCYNESERLDPAGLEKLTDGCEIRLIFVDDGSSDDTRSMLDEFAADSAGAMSVLPLVRNRGKAEAVRQGLLQALADGAELVGFIDADMATPVDEVLRLVNIASRSDADAIIASRIAYSGTDIERSFRRHVLGRVFATAASLALRETIYDTQCGAKLFRRGPAISSAIAAPFSSRWAFDVELLGRLLAQGGQIEEVPLRRWVDVPGSKVSFGSMLKAGLDLVQIGARLRRRR